MSDPRISSVITCVSCQQEEEVAPSLWAFERTMKPMLSKFHTSTGGNSAELIEELRNVFLVNMLQNLVLAHAVRFHDVDPHDESAMHQVLDEMKMHTVGIDPEGFDAAIRKILDEETGSS